ncbi:NAD-dependent epimerase/dehydratase family protein [Candidatus Woesearchaeota archaeon]|nr:NAD-dependent epimerase/dehydratase family protein [Candidatus Woesearchaeota archaeon]
MKVLVTGGAGFIGSNLTEELVRQRHEVIVVDNLEAGKEENLAGVKDKIIFHKEAITNNIKPILKEIDTVFHLAALPRVQFSIHNPIESHETNINGSFNLLKLCSDAGVKRFIFSSSSSVYGDQKTLPLKETMKPNPMSPYALHKLVIEHYCKLFHELYGLKTISLRYFNVYGPKQDSSGDYAILIPKFISMITKDSQPTIRGDGNQTRDFSYVNDVVAANLAAASSNNKKIFGEVFNIGTGKKHSVNQITEKLITLLKSRVRPIHIASVIEPRNTLADITKARDMLDWEPKTNIDEGLKKTAEYFKSLKNNYP